MGMVEVSITEAAVNERIDVLAAYKSVTNVWFYREIVLQHTVLLKLLNVNRSSLTETNSRADRPVLVEVVADLRENLVSCNSISVTVFRRSDTDVATYVNLCVCCNCNESNCKCH